jgi:hypothetical protein
MVVTMTNHLALAAGIVVALSQVAGAQPGSSRAELQGAISTLAASAASIPANQHLPRLTSALQWMRNNAAKTDEANLSQEYVRSLVRAATLLSQRPSADALEDVVRELEAKVEHCRRLGIGMGGSVLLTVNTKRAGRVVGDWHVLYLLKFDEWLKTSPRNFFRVSSPTEMAIEPGRYVIWAHDPATGTTSARLLVEVAGRKELTLDIVVP